MSLADVEIRCHNFKKYFVEANFLMFVGKFFSSAWWKKGEGK
jgi:hypothetical protein